MAEDDNKNNERNITSTTQILMHDLLWGREKKHQELTTNCYKTREGI